MNVRVATIVVVLALVVGCGADTPDAAENEAPTATEAATQAVAAELADVQPRRIEYGDDPAQYGWLRMPLAPGEAADRQPVVVLVHGGFWSEPWDYTLMTPTAEALHDRGIATWNIEFRRLNGRGGWPATFDDVRAAIDHLAVIAGEAPIDLERVVVAGHSSGGHLALWSAGPEATEAGSVQPARAVGIAAVTDLAVFPASVTLLGGPPSTVPQRWSYAQPSLDPALVELVHGARDDIVPLFTVANAEAAGVAITTLDGADHFDVIEAGPTLDRVVDVIAAAVERTGGGD